MCVCGLPSGANSERSTKKKDKGGDWKPSSEEAARWVALIETNVRGKLMQITYSLWMYNMQAVCNLAVTMLGVATIQDLNLKPS